MALGRGMNKKHYVYYHIRTNEICVLPTFVHDAIQCMFILERFKFHEEWVYLGEL